MLPWKRVPIGFGAIFVGIVVRDGWENRDADAC